MRFSVITISYNQSRFLEETIRSVVSQRDDNIDVEYIVVDPGSTDGSRAILQNYADKIDHLILDPDEGPADGLNRGFQQATGDVFGFINADDLLAAGALVAVRDWFEHHPTSQAVIGSLRLIDEDGKSVRASRLPIGSVAFPPRLTLRGYLDRSTTVLQQSTFFRRSAWETTTGFNIQNNVSWDGELLVDMLLGGVRFDRIPTILASFRLHSASLTASINGSSLLASDVAGNTARRRHRLAEAGVHPSSPLISAARRFAWRIRPANRVSGWIVEWRAR